MEKKVLRGFVNLQKALIQSLCMNLLICFFLGVSLNVAANDSVFNNNYVLNLSFENTKVREILEEISDQSGVKIAYSNDVISDNSRVSVRIKTSDMKEALKAVLGTEYTFKQIENYIAIAKKEEKPDNPQQDDRNWIIQGQVFEQTEPPYPLAGVNIQIKGTKIGTVTDVGGYFSIQAKRGDVILFTYLGFKSFEHVVSRAIGNLNVSLQEDMATLNEVVVTGFSEERKLNTISSIATLNVSSNLMTKPITSLSQALQGGITGLAVRQESGLPGADAAAIKIRGISTLGESDPLVLVDGIPMDMNNLDPNTIESVTVLKDAAAAAIYGARAANGVIVIKTKRGMPGKVNVSYNGYYGVQKATYLPEFIDGAGYMEMVNAAYINTGGDPIYTPEAIQKTRDGGDPYTYPNTNWADFLFGNGAVQGHSVGVSGGSSIARFALNVNYLDTDGLIEKANSDRLSIRANTSVSLLDNLSVNMDFNSYRTNRQEPMYRANNRAKEIIGFMYTTPPNTVPRYPLKEGSDIVYYGNRPEQRNPAALIDRGGRYKALEDNVSINIAPRWEVIPHLILRGQYSYRISSKATNEKRASYHFFDYQSGALLETWASINNATKDRSSYYYLGGTAEYTFERYKHRLFAIGGYNQELTNNGDWDQWSMSSFYAKANYTFDRRYLLEATIRRDGSSRFGPGEKYGYFPSIAAGWNANEESFMKSVWFIDNLKFRGSYGLLGNENIGLYKYQTLVNAANGNETVFGNPDITWETVHMLNVGVDFSFMRDFTITFDYYNKLTKDMIITPPISYIGGTTAAALNSGEVRNKGWELDINYNKTFKDLGFNIHAGISQNKNKIEALFGDPYDNGGTIHKVGHALNSFYVYQTDGLLQEKDFTKNDNGNWVPKEGVIIYDGQQPGDIKYVDVDRDGKITTADRVIRGNDQPDFNYFANISVKYKKWDFEILFQGVQGVDAYYSEPYSFGLNVGGDGQTPLKVQKDFWTPSNPNARYPRMAPSSIYGNNNHTSDFWHFDASYCRVKYIQLGYTFDQMALKKIGISNIRLYLNAQNPFTIAKESLVDPEGRGQKSSYPLVKTYSAGISLNF